jgi:hypothetical protein
MMAKRRSENTVGGAVRRLAGRCALCWGQNDYALKDEEN